jgi:hypothetical protein
MPMLGVHKQLNKDKIFFGQKICQGIFGMLVKRITYKHLRMNRYLIIGIALVVSSFATYADMFTPSPSCFKPSKPYQFNSQWQVDNWNDEVMNYKNCISEFIDEQNGEANKHQEAASAAIDEWNSFVQFELN